jgi:hypothetical protein
MGEQWLYYTDMHPTKRRAKCFLVFSVTLFFSRFNLKKKPLIKFFLLHIRYGRDKTYTATNENINKTRFPFLSSQFYILDHTISIG